MSIANMIRMLGVTERIDMSIAVHKDGQVQVIIKPSIKPTGMTSADPAIEKLRAALAQPVVITGDRVNLPLEIDEKLNALAEVREQALSSYEAALAETIEAKRQADELAKSKRESKTNKPATKTATKADSKTKAKPKHAGAGKARAANAAKPATSKTTITTGEAMADAPPDPTTVTTQDPVSAIGDLFANTPEKA